jgi:hypothetical protein
MKRFQTQLESDSIYREALRNSTFHALRERARDDQNALARDIALGLKKKRDASLAGVKARMLWTTKNQNRLIRVFA